MVGQVLMLFRRDAGLAYHRDERMPECVEVRVAALRVAVGQDPFLQVAAARNDLQSTPRPTAEELPDQLYAGVKRAGIPRSWTGSLGLGARRSIGDCVAVSGVLRPLRAGALQFSLAPANPLRASHNEGTPVSRQASRRAQGVCGQSWVHVTFLCRETVVPTK